MLLVCPCRDHHDDSDGVHGERRAGLFSQGECWELVLTLGVCHLLGLWWQCPLELGISHLCRFLLCFTEARGTIHGHPARLHVAGNCLWHEVPGRDGVHTQKPCCSQSPREQQPGLQNNWLQTTTRRQNGDHLLHHGKLRFQALLSAFAESKTLTERPQNLRRGGSPWVQRTAVAKSWGLASLERFAAALNAERGRAPKPASFCPRG